MLYQTLLGPIIRYFLTPETLLGLRRSTWTMMGYP